MPTKSPVKILTVVTQLESGGAQTVAISLHREFLARNLNSRLIFLYEKDKTVFPQRDYETCLEDKPSSLIDYVKVLMRLRRVWKSFEPTYVISHTHYANNACALMRETGLPGTLLATHHNVHESYPRLARRIERLSQRVRPYDGEICVSNTVRGSLPQASSANRAFQKVIINGQSLEPSAASRDDARSQFGLPMDKFIIGNIGRLSEQKNQSFLIDLLPKLPDAHVAILGEGHLRERLSRQAEALGVSGRLHLMGSVVHERVPAFFRALDVFAMPSLFEGMSIAMLEALVAGIPFLGSDVPSIREVTNGGYTTGAGLALPLEQDRWLQEIKRLAGDEAWRQDLIERETARANDYTTSAMATSYLEFIETVRAARGNA